MKLFFSIILFFPLFVKAQESGKAAELFCTNDYNGTNMIKIKWLYKSVYEPNGFDIYRKEGGSSWQKLNSSPIKFKTTLPPSNQLDKEAKDLHNALVKTEFKDFSTSITRAFVLIKAIYVDELADNIGITWDDNQISSGKVYEYKLCLTGSTEAIGLSKPITATTYSKPNPPEEVRFTRSKKLIKINWKPEMYRYYAVDIYKKSDQATEFTKITKVPRAIQKDQADKYSEKSVFFEDTSVVYEDNYTYKFIAIDYFGQSSDYSIEYSVPAEDFEPPTAPFDVVPTGSSVRNNVRLDWKVIEESDLNGINIYQSLYYDSGWEKVNSALISKEQLNYTHENVEAGGHYYQVATVDLAGNESKSPPVFIEIKDVVPPAKPNGLTSEAGEGYITLKWSANTEPDLAGYLVQRSLKSESGINNSYVNVNRNPIKELTYTEKLPRNVKNEFVYRVVAIDTNFNRSTPSENTLAKMPDVVPPIQPLIKNISSDTNVITIEWLANVDVDLGGYNVYRRIMGDSLSIQKVNYSLIPPSVTSYKDRNVKEGTAYEYFLEASDKDNNFSKKSPPYYAKSLAAELKGEIIIEHKKVNAKKGSLNLEWSNTSTEKVKGYVVYHQKSENLPFKPITGLIIDNHVTINIGENINGLFFIKCYTEKGKTIQSKNFDLITK